MQNNFDQKAFTFENNPMHQERAKTIADSIKKIVLLKEECHLADFGCGTGFLGLNFYGEVAKITMIDTSANMLSVLDEKISRLALSGVETLNLDIEKEDVPSGEFDIIVTLMTFHHIEKIKEAVERLNIMIKNEGYLCISDLDEEDGTYHPDADTVHNGINRDALKEILNSAGFRIIDDSIVFVVKKEVMGHGMKDFPIFLIAAQKQG